MTDMPDTTFTSDPSHHEDTQETDDAADYYTPGDAIAENKAPGGPIDERWGTRQFEARIANPANRRRLSVIDAGTGLAGASAAATLGEAGHVGPPRRGPGRRRSLRGEVVLLPGLGPAGPLDRRPEWDLHSLELRRSSR